MIDEKKLIDRFVKLKDSDALADEIVRTGGDTIGETHTGTIHGPAGGRTGSEPPDPAGGRPTGEDGRKGICSI